MSEMASELFQQQFFFNKLSFYVPKKERWEEKIFTWKRLMIFFYFLDSSHNIHTCSWPDSRKRFFFWHPAQNRKEILPFERLQVKLFPFFLKKKKKKKTKSHFRVKNEKLRKQKKKLKAEGRGKATLIIWNSISYALSFSSRERNVIMVKITFILQTNTEHE